MKNYSLGIMVCHAKGDPPFGERYFFRLLQRKGEKLGLNVFVFNPLEIDWQTKKLKGYFFHNSKEEWQNKTFSLPTFVYDRCFYNTTEPYKKYKDEIKKLKQYSKFLGVGLQGKWEVYQILKNNPKWKRYLPPTEIFTDFQQLWSKNADSILKPIAGSHGIGIIYLKKNGDYWNIIGRDNRNNFFQVNKLAKEKVEEILLPIINKRKYLLQPYLHLSDSEEKPFDIRVLAQKGKSGNWGFTGMAVRVGEKEHITSNLHGGGTAIMANNFLKNNFPNKEQELIEKIKYIALNLPPDIEKEHGELIEVGIDIGIDREANLWLIEVNSKPGRKVFALTNEKEKLTSAIYNPLYYTYYLSQKKQVNKLPLINPRRKI